jgi:hypothetical protein
MTTRQILILISLTTILIFGCKPTDQKNQNSTTMDKFTWNIQLAGYDFNKYDEKGETTYENFISEFDKFPWIEQMEKRNTINDGCSATLSVKDLKAECDLWVSIAGDKNNYGYLVGYVHPKEVKGFFGLGKAKTKRWCDIYQTQNVNDIKSCFKLFFERKLEDLVNSINKLDKFGDMEAQN